MACFLILAVVLVLLVLTYFYLKHSATRTFRDMGVDTPPVTSFFGHLNHVFRHGFTTSQTIFYNMYKDKKGVAMNFIFAGFDTVSQTFSFTLFLLAMHPQCLQRAQAEIDDKIGRDMPNYDNVQELLYLDMCVNETLRIYPAIAMLGRQCTEDVTIQGIHIPKGMAVAVPMYSLHHDPELWTDPEKFDPERFRPELKASRNPYCFSPFGHGPRNCIGMRLGLVELKVALASVLQTFTPVPCSKTVYPIVLASSVFLKPKDGLWVKLEARK